MIKKEMSIKRCLIAASMAGTMVLSSIPAVPVFAATEDGPTVGAIYAQYDGSSDRIVVYEEGDGEKGYYGEDDTVYQFYTTKKPTAKSIPSSEKWTYSKYGRVDISSVAKKATYYFATSPNPSSLKEIVAVEFPAKGKATAVKYAPKNLWIEASNAAKAEETRDKNARDSFTGATDKMEYKVDGYYNEWLDFHYKDDDDDVEYGLDSTELEEWQANGAKVTFRGAGTSQNLTPKDATDTAPMTVTIPDNSRPTKEKTVKVAKRANGPAVKIDYANHTLTLKKNTSVLKIDSYDEADTTYLTNTTGNGGWVTSDQPQSFDVSNFTKYAVKTAAVDGKKAASAPTFVTIASANASLKSTGATVAIVGEYEQPAVLYAQGTDNNTTFQYAFTSDLSKIFFASGDAKKFSYSGAKELKWKKLATGKNAKFKTANIKWNDVKTNSYVVVRKAAVGSEFSSNVVVFKAPEKDGRWTFLQQNEVVDEDAKWPAASADAHRSMKMYIDYESSTSTSDASSDALKVTFNGGGSTINADSKGIEASIDTSKNITVKYTGAKKAIKVTADSSKNTLTFVGPENGSNVSAVFTFPAGTFKYKINNNEFVSPKMTYTVTYTRGTVTTPEAYGEDKELTADPDDSADGNTTGGGNKKTQSKTVPTVTSVSNSVEMSAGTNYTGTIEVNFSSQVTEVGTISLGDVKVQVSTPTLSSDGMKATATVTITAANWGGGYGTRTGSTDAGSILGEYTVTVSGFKYDGGTVETDSTKSTTIAQATS